MIVSKSLAELKDAKAKGAANAAAAMLSAGFGADALIYAGYTESELTAAGISAAEYTAVAASASLYREQYLSDDVGGTGAGSTNTAPSSTGISVAYIAVPVVLCSVAVYIVANIIFSRKSRTADDGDELKNGLPQQYANPAYDASPPGDADSDLQVEARAEAGAVATAETGESWTGAAFAGVNDAGGFTIVSEFDC